MTHLLTRCRSDFGIFTVFLRHTRVSRVIIRKRIGARIERRQFYFAILVHQYAGEAIIRCFCNSIVLIVQHELKSTHSFSIILRAMLSLQTSEQKLIFQIPPADCRKIILSTNVGAVGITITDLVYVIDTGKVEQVMLRSYLFGF